MTVSNRQLSILAAVATAMVVVTIVIYGVECKPPAEFEKGSLLIQGLELDKIGQITIKKEDKTVTLTRQGKGFVVPERGGYPASVKKVNELFIDCLGIRIADKVTASAKNHGELGVTEDSEDATLIAFYGDEIRASQILITYSDAAEAPAELERSRTEARTLADQVLTKAKAKDADFAALAEEHSDGPGKAEGGDLGPVKRGTLAANLEAAAWRLRPGEISTVIETPAGFHIIRRNPDVPLVAVVAGKSVSRGSGTYVRRLDQDTVYASEKSLYLATEVTSYIETEILDVKKDDVIEAHVEMPDESYTVHRNKDDKIVLAEVPEGKKQKDYDVEAVLDALSYLTFNEVVTEQPEGLKLDATYTAKTKNHLTYTIRLGKVDDKHYAKVAARGPSRAELERAGRIGKDEPKEKLEEKDKILTAADKADEFNSRHGSWLYELSSWKAEKMRKPLKDLLEDIEKEPEEIAASHILVAYKGAEKAGDDITRTKDEAKKRAEELLKKVKADGADFAEIARKESDGPSKTKGGDLGTFKKGKMHKNFEEAAWKLEVDEISDVVETPFGFHIIKRTK